MFVACWHLQAAHRCLMRPIQRPRWIAITYPAISIYDNHPSVSPHGCGYTPPCRRSQSCWCRLTSSFSWTSIKSANFIDKCCFRCFDLGQSSKKLHYVALCCITYIILHTLESRIRTLAWPYSTIASINTAAVLKSIEWLWHKRHLAGSIYLSALHFQVGPLADHRLQSMACWNLLCGKECIQCPMLRKSRMWTCVYNP